MKPKFSRAIGLRLHASPNLTTPAARVIRREYSRVLLQAGAKDVLFIAQRLLREATALHRFMAYELIYCHRAALASLRAKDLERLGRGLDSWGAVDTFACYLSGPAWRARQVPDTMIVKWARARDLWRRRAALVSTVPLNRKALGGAGNTKRTLRICGMLVKDREDMVVKALSWALRELAKRDAKAVRGFIAKHENQLAARVVREVRNKLRTGLKNPVMDHRGFSGG
ncbi:MAG: DNA alkylation repair protein [candidate division KSB1 bacterium]